MLEQAIRKYYQSWLVDPIVNRLSRQTQPLHITCLAGMMGLLTIPAMLCQQSLIAVFFLLLSGYLDTVDGSAARRLNKTSPAGAVADILTDRAVEFAIIIALWLYDPLSRSVICLLMMGVIMLCVTSFLVVGIFTPNESTKSFHYSPGLIERAEAFIFFSFMMLFPAYFTSLGFMFVALVLLTTIIRVREFFRSPYAL